MKSEEWIGFRQGVLTIVRYEGLNKFAGGGKAAMFRFRCDCGREFSAQKSNVIRGNRQDCGHGRVVRWTSPPGTWKHPLRKTWLHMLDRCLNERCIDYRNYGARGITICVRWRTGADGRTGFENFIADMGPKPKGNYTLERVLVNGNYEPGNCMWLPKGDQSKNRRVVKLVRIGTEARTIPDWCKRTGVGYWTAIQRINRGWPPDRAVTQPPRGYR